MSLINKPRQERSLATQEKLLNALETLLEERFFEQISIRDISSRAGVSPGTIYRRFRNKEALLPILYERFDHRLCGWAKNVWKKYSVAKHPGLFELVNILIKEHVSFYQDNSPILRTLYLYTRLNGDMSLPDLETRRKSVYSDLLAPIIEELAASGNMESELKIRFFIQLLISSINERILFADYKPSKLLQIDQSDFERELTCTLISYLTSNTVNIEDAKSGV